MKNSDEAMDRVFAGLRDVEPAEGMERRILARVHQRAAAPQAMPFRWFVVGGFALAAAAVVALLLSPRHVATPAPMQAILQPHVQPQSLPPEPLAVARPRRHTPAIRANAEVPVPMASFPAPPMPLTEQERLLVQVARRGEPAALPMLDPDALARQEAHAEQVLEAALSAAQPPSILIHKEDIP